MTASALPRPTHSILVVDDEEINRELLLAMLAPEAYEVILASTGSEALTILQERRVDLVLLDFMMPGRSGVETCRDIRRTLKVWDVPIVFVTALSDRSSRLVCVEAGANDFLTKPIDQAELLLRIENLLQLRQFYRLRDTYRSLGDNEARAAAAPESIRSGLEGLSHLLARRDVGGALQIAPDDVETLSRTVALMRAHFGLAANPTRR